MVNYVLENPLLIGVGGAVLTLGFLWGWIQSGHKALLWSGVAVLVISLLAVVTSLQIQTPREEIEAFLEETANDVQNNDYDKLLAKIHPSATATVQRARDELKQYRFSMAKITRIRKIEVDESQGPKAAVEMNVIAEGTFQNFSGKVPRYVEFTLVKKDKEWLLFDYSHHDPIEGFR